MEHIFGILFVVYAVYVVVAALIQRARAGRGPALPPVARPDLFPWLDTDEAREKTQPDVAPVGPETAGAPPGERRSPLSGESLPADIETVWEAQGARLAAGEGPGEGASFERNLAHGPQDAAEWGASPRRSGVSQSASAAPPLGSRVALSAASLREALIVSELLAPPRALRPYEPFDRRRPR